MFCFQCDDDLEWTQQEWCCTSEELEKKTSRRVYIMYFSESFRVATQESRRWGEMGKNRTFILFAFNHCTAVAAQDSSPLIINTFHPKGPIWGHVPQLHPHVKRFQQTQRSSSCPSVWWQSSLLRACGKNNTWLGWASHRKPTHRRQREVGEREKTVAVEASLFISSSSSCRVSLTPSAD